MKRLKDYMPVIVSIIVVTALAITFTIVYRTYIEQPKKNNNSNLIADSIASSEAASDTENTSSTNTESSLSEDILNPVDTDNENSSITAFGTTADNTSSGKSNTSPSVGTTDGSTANVTAADTSTSAPTSAAQQQTRANTPSTSTTQSTTSSVSQLQSLLDQAGQSTQASQSTTTQGTSSNSSGGSSGSTSDKELVLQYTNQIRQAAGVADLVLDSQLSAMADTRAQEIVESFSHTRPNGTTFSTLAQEMGISYRTIGENIAYGYSSAASVVEAWKNSSGHYANMVNSSYNKLGVGVYVKNGTYYWVQNFTN